MSLQMTDPYLPFAAEILDYTQEDEDIFTIRLCPTEKEVLNNYHFLPGQFNMLYLYGVGEVAISIVNDREFKPGFFEHTIQVIGRVTKGLAKVKKGQSIGVRGPFGTCWPSLETLRGKDIVVVTGGLGNAPLVAQVEALLKERSAYNRLYVIQGLRHADGLIYRDKYTRWNQTEGVAVELAASSGDFFGAWTWHRGFVTEAIPHLKFDVHNTVVLTVGPEIMMTNVAKAFIDLGVAASDIYVSLERSMKCALGHCGHCQLGAQFICKDGPVYSYQKVASLLAIEGV